MKFFLDTSLLSDINYWKKLNLVDGVTTNTSLLSKNKGDVLKNLTNIIKTVNGPISAQVTYHETEQMIKQGMSFAKLSKNIVIKLPSNVEGLKAAKYLKKIGKKVNITLGFEPSQIIAFAKINVDYFSLIYGKTEDWGFSNLNSISETKKILGKLNSKTKLLVASLRNPDHLKNAIINGADVVTVPPSTWEKVYTNKYSNLANKRFISDWKKINKINKYKYEKI